MKKIGWKETLDLPDWHIRNMLAKMDTGARGSAIDVKDIIELPDNRVRFAIVLHRKDRSQTHTVEAPIHRRTRIRSSNGQCHDRFVVCTRLRIAGIEKTVELSLVNRKRMICRMLLGRTALAGTFLVDSSEKYLAGKRKAPSVQMNKKPHG